MIELVGYDRPNCNIPTVRATAPRFWHLLFLRKVSKPITHPDIGAIQDVQAAFDLRRTFLFFHSVHFIAQSSFAFHLRLGRINVTFWGRPTTWTSASEKWALYFLSLWHYCPQNLMNSVIYVRVYYLAWLQRLWL